MIRAKYTGGVLKPLDELDLNKREIVSIIIEKKIPTGIAGLVSEMRGKTPKTDDPVKILGELRK
ncbi:MAG: antitoxin family protein [Desulfurococcales archaeon]|nr:antitoxin family protein [Desulfurococcales archaeon]